ncbi:homeobox protein 5-like isoform X2 [Tetranychus urticae]|uniref:homeobox protein 5-like isoform X2 n=1 Tax=Tetranychus urticae TaxID=32264 RepID=UPI000D65B2C2|nr:homeobox protein 5-like isoform X2 [Tetranychus urticae]
MKILCCCFHSTLTCNLFLLTLLTVLQSNGLWAEHTFNSSLGETQVDSVVSIIPSNGREKGENENTEPSNFNVESIIDSDEQSFSQLEDSQSSPNSTSEIDEHKNAGNNNNDEDNNRLISYLEGKIIEIVPITQVPIEDYSENYHSQSNGTGLLSDMENSESIQSTYHHNEPPMEPSEDGKEVEKRDKVTNNEDEDKLSSDERKHENVNNSNATQDVNSSPSASIHSYNDLRASANSVAVKVAEVKKKSLAAKMMEKLRKSDKGTDDAKKNIIVVSNGGSSGESSSGSHGYDGNAGHHHHHHHQQLVAPVEPIPSHQIVPIFTPIHENFDSKSGDHRLHHSQQQQQQSHQSYPLFHHNEGNGQGEGTGETNSEGSRGAMMGNDGLPGSPSAGHYGQNLGDLSRAVAQHNHLANLAEGEGSGMTGSQGSSNMDGNSQVESGWPSHVDSNGEPNDVMRGHLGHVNQMPGPVGMSGRLHGNRRLQGSGSSLSEQLLHPMSSSSHDLSGTSSGSPSFSSVIESLGLNDASSSPSGSGSSESRFTGLSDIIRNSMLINSPREPEVTPFFESAKGDHSHHHQHHPSSETSNPLNGNTNLKAFSLLSDSGLSNYPSLLSRSNDLSSSLLGSSLGSSSSGGSSGSTGSSLNDRLLALLEHSSKSVDDLNDHLNPLTSSAHGLTELTSSRLGGSSLFNEDIGLDDALKRLTMIEMLNKKQIPLTTGLIDELREPSPLHGSNNANPLAFIDNDLRKYKNLQQLAQVQQAIKKSQNSRILKSKAFNREHSLTTGDSDDDTFDTQLGSRGGRGSTGGMRGNGGMRSQGASSDDESGDRGGRRFRPGPRMKTFDALAKFREQRERLKDRFRSSSSAALNGGVSNGGMNGKTKVEEEEEEYEESGVEHEGDESRSILLGWKKPSRSEEQLITFTDNFHHLNGQLTNSLSSLLHSPSSSSLLTPSSQASIQSSPTSTSTLPSYANAQAFNRGTNHQQQQQSNSFSPQQLKFFNHHSILAHQLSPFAHHPNHHQYIHSQYQQTKLNQ